ncbi:PREDICTED: VQ motif-containing protein 1-like [Ipomoea nil]|uniref:VQ motif-containing protein 1-like n=1 Tax=Ipomoea nil TaxID=35883 RepID=UPI000901EB62|nr:PREDICTED: VQ motif-containing protein 1-like [Ipomoea nil]
MSRGGSNNNGGAGRPPLKVVIISTQYVETDARSFKSVVQRLTGKDSTAAATKNEHHYGGVVAAAESNPPLSRGLSFKDFDKLFKELPPVDELYRAIY